MLAFANRWWPAVAGVLAVGWILYREPAWPGFMLLFFSAGAGLGRLLQIYAGLESYSPSCRSANCPVWSKSQT